MSRNVGRPHKGCTQTHRWKVFPGIFWPSLAYIHNCQRAGIIPEWVLHPRAVNVVQPIVALDGNIIIRLIGKVNDVCVPERIFSPRRMLLLLMVYRSHDLWWWCCSKSCIDVQNASSGVCCTLLLPHPLIHFASKLAVDMVSTFRIISDISLDDMLLRHKAVDVQPKIM